MLTNRQFLLVGYNYLRYTNREIKPGLSLQRQVSDALVSQGLVNSLELGKGRHVEHYQGFLCNVFVHTYTPPKNKKAALKLDERKALVKGLYENQDDIDFRAKALDKHKETILSGHEINSAHFANFLPPVKESLVSADPNNRLSEKQSNPVDGLFARIQELEQTVNDLQSDLADGKERMRKLTGELHSESERADTFKKLYEDELKKNVLLRTQVQILETPVLQPKPWWKFWK